MQTTEDRDKGDQRVDQKKWQLFMFQGGLYSWIQKAFLFRKACYVWKMHPGKQRWLKGIEVKRGCKTLARPNVYANLLSASSTESVAIAPAGWALTQAKRAYRFNEGPRRYLEGRFNIGQESGIRTDADVVAKEMWRIRGTNGEILFRVSEFLATHLVTPFLTRELRACVRASCRHDVENGTRSLARLVDSCKLFSILGF